MWARGELINRADDADNRAEVDEAAAAFGLVVEGPAVPAEPVYYLWPDNLRAWQLFHGCATQWRVGMAGREGLDYGGVEVVMRRRGVRDGDRMFALVQACEGGALDGWAEKREEQERKG